MLEVTSLPATAPRLQRTITVTATPPLPCPGAHLVALALEHGVQEILTLDGDFTRFPQVASRNPFPA